jgi:hypothetical protein
MGTIGTRDTVAVSPTGGDVVKHRRRLTLLNHSLTPRDAMIADLLFVRAALVAGGIRFLLVRSTDDRPIISIDLAQRAQAFAALEASAVGEPLYAKIVSSSVTSTPVSAIVSAKKGHKNDQKRRKRSPRLVSDGAFSRTPDTDVFVLFRPRVELTGALRFGAAHGVRLEFWTYSLTNIVAPRENALTRRNIVREDVSEITIERYGVTWRTIAGMFDKMSGDIDFPIDMVFSWVDGADLEFQRARATRMKSYVVGEGDDHEARFRQLDELRYALRSVYLFAPWVRRIFIVTDSPSPVWLAEHPSVTIMRSEDFFSDPSVLPTHNSQAVESQLHHIPGLAEHFLYSNDDMFFGRPVTPDMFFTAGGISKFVEASTRIGLGSTSLERSGFENAARVNRALLQEHYGVTITRHLEHCAAPLRVSVLNELDREFPNDFTRTAASAFRASTDISVTNSLYHFFALHTGRAIVQTTAKVKYVDTTMFVGLRDMDKLLQNRSQDMFCLNDGSFPEISSEVRADAVRSFLDRYFAIAAPWETLD